MFWSFVFQLHFSMVVITRGVSSSGDEPIDEKLHEFTASKITWGILEATSVIFGLIKEGMIELMEERLGVFHVELKISQFGSYTLTFRDFRSCGDPEFFGKKGPISSRGWIADMENAQMTRSCHTGEKAKFSTCLLRDWDRHWWEEVGHTLGAPAIETMTWQFCCQIHIGVCIDY